MLLQWCLKGVACTDEFDDQAAADVLRKDGLASAWLRSNAGLDVPTGMADYHSVLSEAALDAHVNNFGVACVDTPYISLTAGCVTTDPVTGRTSVHSALVTAVAFATGAVWGETLLGLCF